jgi:hypothetical protein
MDNPQNEFIKKPLEQPILNSDVQAKITPKEIPNAGESFTFYQTNKYYIWAISAGLLVILVLAFFAFKKPAAPIVKEASVEVLVTAPDSVPSGGDGYYTIKLTNNDSQKLSQVRLELAYPQGLSYISSVPKADNLSGTVFTVPDLISGQNAAIIVRAKALGNVGDQEQLIARMFYHYNNFSSEFVKEKAFTFVLSASSISLDLSGPDTVSNSQLVSYVVKYKNNSEQPVQNARIVANFPQGFNLAQAAPQVSLGQNIWEISSLNPGQEGQIEMQGNFSGSNAGESKNFSVQFMVLGQNGDYNSQNSAQKTTAISSLPLLVSQEVSTYSDNAGGVVKPGDTLQFNIKYQNNSSVAANGVNIVVSLDSKALDISSVQAEGGQVNNNTIIWSAAGVPNLEILNPSESGTLHFSVAVKNPASKDSSTNLTVNSQIKIKSNEYQTFLPGNSLSLKISSPGKLNSALSFVSGQLPPKVGQVTTYKVQFTVTNSSNSYSDGMLTAFLPLGLVSFNSQSVTPAESQNVQFDPSTGKLTWNAGVVSANAGRFSSPKILEFNISVNPSQSLSAQSPALVKTINFSAKDSFTSDQINLSTENITTASIEGGYGNGSVQQ